MSPFRAFSKIKTNIFEKSLPVLMSVMSIGVVGFFFRGAGMSGQGVKYFKDFCLGMEQG